MKQAFVLPSGSPKELFDDALLAADAGWDGVFLWESGYTPDPWTILAAIAARTERIRLGTMLTPLAWRRPWKLAAQTMTLDHLSDGRTILAVGLGAVDAVLGRYGEVTDRRTRADLVDEGIDILDTLWRGERVYKGTHYEVDLTELVYPVHESVQKPRIPIWCVGAMGRPKSMRRIVRCDGLIPTYADKRGQPDPSEVAEMLAWLDANGGRRPGFEVIVEGETTEDDISQIQPWVATADWWLETRWSASSPAAVRERIAAGPVKL